MNASARWLLLALFGALGVLQAQAQTEVEVVEKNLAAMGGRGALAKLETRIATGSVAISTEGSELAGPLVIYLKAPNKSRTLIRLDLSQFGAAAEMVIDQRCDGTTAIASNSLQGDREITGNQLRNMLNASFPTPLLKYKEAGAKVELAGKEKVGSREAFVLLFTPKTGSASRLFVDAETWLLLRAVVKVESPELGGEVEQTSDMSGLQEVDGVKVPFAVAVVNPAQRITIPLTKVEHNQPIDETMFSRPAVK
jgi:outer membrane lipoprotein-sorting protein